MRPASSYPNVCLRPWGAADGIVAVAGVRAGGIVIRVERAGGVVFVLVRGRLGLLLLDDQAARVVVVRRLRPRRRLRPDHVARFVEVLLPLQRAGVLPD